MKIAIVGIGGVGGYYGGKLAVEYASSNNHEIYFFARGQHLAAIKKDGLRVKTKEGDFTAVPTCATDNPEELGLLDLIFFCVKGYDLEDSARMIAGNLHDGSVAIPLLNGVNNAERLKTVLDKGIVINGCVYISTHIVQPGMIEQIGGSCKLIFGPETGPVDPYRKIETLLKAAGINAVLSDNIAVDAWSKYLFVGPLGSITSMVGKSLGEIMENENDRTMLEGMMREVASVAEARNIPLPDDIVQQSLDIASNFPYETKTSIQLDFEKGTRTELDTFTGYLVRAGKSTGIATPLHDEVYKKLKEKGGT